MSRAFFHGGSNVDETGKFTHCVVAWSESDKTFKHLVKCITPAQAAKYFAEFTDAFADVFTVGVYPYVAVEK